MSRVGWQSTKTPDRIGSVVHQIQDFSDQRNKAWCVHCRSFLADVEISRDHVPSKALLTEPYPAELPTVPVCAPCNEDFAHDEEYFAAFLGCVLSGSTEPQAQFDPRTSRILKRGHGLRERIERSKIEYTTGGGSTRMVWSPEVDRLKRVILKNARGHALYEYGEPMPNEPSYVWFSPLTVLTDAQRSELFQSGRIGVFPEVGSRMLTRAVTGEDLVDGWVEVQNGSYRYTVVERGALVVRSIVREYLVTEVSWEY